MRRSRKLTRLLVSACLIGASAGVTVGEAQAGEGGTFPGPCAIAASRDGNTLYVANADAGQVAFVRLPDARVDRTVSVPSEPTGLALAPEASSLYVTCAAAQSTVLVIDTSSAKVKGRIAVGHTACGPAVSPDGQRLYVCNRFDGNVSVIDVKAGKEVARVPTSREPVSAAITPDGRSVFVANHLPAGRADRYDAAAEVTVIDTTTFKSTSIRLSAGATGARDVCVGPAGKYAYVTHLLARYELPTTQVDHGWMNVNAVSVIDAAGKKLINTVLLDEMELGAANPWSVRCSGDGKWLCITHAGTAELSLIDAPGLLKKLLAVPVDPPPEDIGQVLYDDRTEILDSFRRYRAALSGKSHRYDDRRPLYTLGDAAGVSNDLTFLNRLRRRIKLPGKGTRGLAVAGSRAYAAQYFSNRLCAVVLDPKAAKPVMSVPLGPKPRLTAIRRGQMLFNDAESCLEHWQSCASCHPDGRSDGLNWDLINDGLGNPKNTKSLLLAHKTPPSMSTGVRGSAEAAVRAGIKHILFGKVRKQDAEAIDAYLRSLKAIPSPHLDKGRLRPSARRGRRLFFSKRMGCAKCHPTPLYTDMRTYDVGSKRPYDRRSDFDTPTIIETWRTGPYMHDGGYKTVRELIANGKHGAGHGDVAGLTEQEINDLAEFVLSK